MALVTRIEGTLLFREEAEIAAMNEAAKKHAAFVLTGPKSRVLVQLMPKTVP